jgi:predicted ATP-grasp superfamily ATP-dependent carboligase
VARILVTDAGLGSAVSTIRSLAARGHHVVAASPEPRAAGFFSRAAAETVRYPSPRLDPEGAVETLLAAAIDRRVELIVPVTDEVIIPLAAARNRFDGRCALALPPDEALAVARDKDATLALARRLGVPVPRGALVGAAVDARGSVDELGWPVVVKPRSSRVLNGHGIEALNVSYASSLARLEEQLAPLDGLCPVLLQEYCRGEAYGVELLLHEGRPLAAFQHRRLHEVPITGGASSYRESVALDPTLYYYSVSLLEALRWTGLAMVEFKVGEDGPRLMEINGRIWGSLPLAVRAGMDFPALLADLYLHGPPPPGEVPNTSYELGVRARNLELEMVWIASVLRRQRRYPFITPPPRREALRAAGRLLRASRRDGFDVLALDDPRPGLVHVAGVGAKLVRKVARGG